MSTNTKHDDEMVLDRLFTPEDKERLKALSARLRASCEESGKLKTPFGESKPRF